MFRGELLVREASSSSAALGAWARAIVLEEFGEQPEGLPGDGFRAALTRGRERVAGREGRELAARCLAALQVDVSSLLMDAVRLRAISPGLEKVQAAAPAFYTHRDTWYGNPSCQINGWLPLGAVDGANSFRFYLDDFERAVANDSETFDVAHFEARGGFGRTAGDPMSAYPRALRISDSRVWDVELAQDALLLFSAAHLHATLPNRTAKVRFSLDFRFLRVADLDAGRGAPDPDNRSRGSVAAGYHPCVGS